MQQILEPAGFLPEDDDVFSHPLANDVNRALQQEVNQKQRQLTRYTFEIEDLNERAHAIWELMRDIRTELSESRNLADAKRNQLDSEKHVLKIVARELERLQQECQKAQLTVGDLEQKCRLQEKTLGKQMKELAKAKDQHKLNQDAFQTRLDAVLSADDLNINIQKYKLKDDKAIAEYELHLEKLSETKQTTAKQADRLHTELKATQLELDKSRTSLALALKERQKLIAQWEAAMQLIRKRDSDVEQLNEQLSDCRKETAAKSEAVKDKDQMSKEQEQGAAQLYRELRQLDATLTRLRASVTQGESRVHKLTDELNSCKLQYSSVQSSWRIIDEQLSQMKLDTAANEQKLEQLKATKQAVQENLDDLTKKSASSQVAEMEERIRQLDALEKDQQRQKNQYVEQLRVQKLRLDAHKLENDKLVTEIEEIKLKAKNFDGKLRQLRKDYEKLKETVDAQDATATSLQKQLEVVDSQSGLKGVGDVATIDGKLKITLDQLRTRLAEKEAEVETWSGTMIMTKASMQELKQEIEKESKTKATREAQLNELTNLTQNLEKAKNKLITDKQDVLVQANLLKVEAQRLRDTLEWKETEITEVGKLKENAKHMLLTMQEQSKARKELLQAEFARAEDERKTESQKIKDFFSKVEQLKSKYDIFTLSMKPPEGEKGTIEEYYLNKHMHERGELEKMGDDLDQKIRKSETEIQALQNTLRLLAEKNSAFRLAIAQPTQNNIYNQERAALERTCRELQEQYVVQRRQVKEAEDAAKTARQTILQINEAAVNAEKMVSNAKQQLITFNKELVTQERKVKRSNTQTKKAATNAVKKAGKPSKDKKHYEKDIEFRIHKDYTESILKQFSDIASLYPALAGDLEQQFTQAKIPLIITNLRGRSASQSLASGQAQEPTSAKSSSAVKTLTLDAEAVLPSDTDEKKKDKKTKTRRSLSLNRRSVKVA